MKIGFYSDFLLDDDIEICDDFKEYLNSADVNCLNLEGPFVKNFKSKKRIVSLYNRSSNFSFLKDNKFEILSLANNHMFDFGEENFSYTKEKIIAEGLRYFGAGESIEEAVKPIILEDEKKKIVILGFAWKFTDAIYAKKNRSGCAPLYKEVVKRVLKKYDWCDYRVVYFHFGNEYENFPEPYQKDFVEELFEKDMVDVVIGNHPHCIQGIYQTIVNDKKKYAFYSLGNFSLPEKEYYNGTLKYGEKSALGYGVIIDFQQGEYQLIPYKLSHNGTKIDVLKSSEKKEFEDKIRAFSLPLEYEYKKYKKYYKQVRENKKKLIFCKNEVINEIMGMSLRLYYCLKYYVWKIYKKIMKVYEKGMYKKSG